jgi:hypothetical protein
MGTSQSSKGPPGNVPMVPPWVPSVPPAAPPPASPPPGGVPPAPSLPNAPPTPGAAPNPPPPPLPLQPARLAPAGRFSGARRSLGSFAKAGNATQMRRAVSHFVRKGYGGSGTAAARFGGTAQTADALYSALAPPATGAAAAVAGERLDRTLLEGRSAQEIMNAIVEAVQPVTGTDTQDAEVSRASIKDALVDLLTRFPDANLLELTDDQRGYAIERFVGTDVFRRFILDLGTTIQDKAPSAAVGLARLKEVKNYIKETVAAAFRRVREAGRALRAGQIPQVVQAALADAFQVFEHYSR